MDKKSFINNVIDHYTSMGVNFKYSVGNKGVHVDYNIKDDKILQYNFHIFEDVV